MDPYLESLWPEVHASLIVYARNQLNAKLPGDLQANIEENLTVYQDDSRSAIRPDIHVSQDLQFPSSAESASSAVLAQPLVLRRAPHPTRHVEIVDKDGRVITAIEFLSPWNKVGTGAEKSISVNRWTSSTPV